MEAQVERYAEQVLPMPAVLENKFGDGSVSYNPLLVDCVGSDAALP